MKISKLAALSVLAAASVSASAFAQEAPAADAATTEAPAATAAAPAAGATALAAGQVIYGPKGEEAATVVKVDGANVVISTGTNEATLPASAIGTSEKGPTIAYDKEQLNTAIEAANKQANAGQAAQPGAEQQPEGGQ